MIFWGLPYFFFQIHSSCLSCSLELCLRMYSVFLILWMPALLLDTSALFPTCRPLTSGGSDTCLIENPCRLLTPWTHLWNSCILNWYCSTQTTVRCCYNPVNFLKQYSQRHPIACPLGQGMGCLLWIQHRIDILAEFLQSFIQYLTILNHVVTALDCIFQQETGIVAQLQLL